jgi:hypothetical protein
MRLNRAAFFEPVRKPLGQLLLAVVFSHCAPALGQELPETFPPVWERVTELYINRGPPRQYSGPVEVSNCFNPSPSCMDSRGPEPGIWAVIDLTIPPWNVPGNAKWADLRGRIIITHGSTQEMASAGIAFRAIGDARVSCTQENFMGQGVETQVDGGIRTNMSTWVPLIDGKFEMCWSKSTPGTWPANSSYAFNLSIQAWAR